MRQRQQRREQRASNTNEQPKREPDWIAKSRRQLGRTERLERIGAAWTRDDGGICLRLYGSQIVAEDIYLYPNGPRDDA